MEHLGMRISSFVVVFFYLASSLGNGFDLSNALRGEHTYEQYYQVQNDGTDQVFLLNWLYYQDVQYTPPEKYKRTEHFGGWIQDPTNQTCFDVRGMVLVRQALQPVKIDDRNQCRIDSASWYDPYSDEYFYLASDLQIDHLVPLKNAYLAGAWEWSNAKRCHYGNFLSDPLHLIAVQKHANLSKGDRGPDMYMPLNSQFQCQYLAIWLKIKAVWNLKIAVPEASAIQSFLQENSCPGELFYLSQQELTELQEQTENIPSACHHLQFVETQTLVH
jgi:hypothetical protein